MRQSKKEGKMRICVGAWAGGTAWEIPAKLGFPFDTTTDTWPIKEMTKEELLSLVSQAMDMGVGVMVKPPYPNKHQAPPYDFTVWLDTAEGRFRCR